MEMQGCFCGGDVSMQKAKANQVPMKDCGSDEVEPSSSADCFDCNICFDFASDPVVTLCGHLYCWPCIYKWMQLDKMSPQQCPVCKASLSENTLVPLYGRGNTVTKTSFKIPRRPSAQADYTDSIPEEVYSNIAPSVQRRRHHHRSDSYYMTSVLHSTAGCALGGIAMLLLPVAFRNASPYQQLIGGSNPRVRRQEIRAERILHQIWMLLLFCAFLCLFFF